MLAKNIQFYIIVLAVLTTNLKKKAFTSLSESMNGSWKSLTAWPASDSFLVYRVCRSEQDHNPDKLTVQMTMRSTFLLKNMLKILFFNSSKQIKPSCFLEQSSSTTGASSIQSISPQNAQASKLRH